MSTRTRFHLPGGIDAEVKVQNISPPNRKPSAADSGYRTEDLGVTCRHPQPLSHSGYPSGFLRMSLCIVSSAEIQKSRDVTDDGANEMGTFSMASSHSMSDTPAVFYEVKQGNGHCCLKPNSVSAAFYSKQYYCQLHRRHGYVNAMVTVAVITYGYYRRT